MAFPWKKVKKSSISKLVKEHVHSQSGSPLMVETGFPTSLVDLVVKNRGRFKKPSSKKKKSSLLPPPPLLSPPPPPPSSSSSCIDSSELLTVDDQIPPLIREGEKAKKMKKSSQFEEGWGNGGVSMNQGLVAVLKMVMVVGLVLGMKNLVVGITMSAFLLFFLEYLGERVYGLFKPLFELQRRIWEILRTKMVKEQEDECVFKAPSLQREDGCLDFGCRIQEIEVVQEKSYAEESQCGKEKIEEGICDGESGCEGADVEGVVMEKGEELRCELSESKERKSHRAKMKSKMKKLVPKKFRKKKGSALESHMISNEVDDVSEGKKGIEGYSEPKFKSDNIMPSVACRIDDKTKIIEEVGSVTSVGESSRGLTDGSGVVESFEGIDKATTTGVDGLIEREHSSMYVVLLLAVLVGLIGGRILALVFTLTCCLMSKRGEGIRRYTKLPVIRSFVKLFS